MNTAAAKTAAEAFAINFADMIAESTENGLPQGLDGVLNKVRDFATKVGELDQNRPDSDTAYFQESMGQLWVHAQAAVREVSIVRASTNGPNEMSRNATVSRSRRSTAIHHMVWIEHILREAVENS